MPGSTRPIVLDTWMMRPDCWRRIAGSTARFTRIGPKTLRSNSASIWDWLNASIGPTAARPALLTATSIRPAESSIVATALFTDSSLVTSISTTSIAAPRSSPHARRARACSPFFALTSRMPAKTRWPAAARVRDMSAPKPLLQPVIRIVLGGGAISVRP